MRRLLEALVVMTVLAKRFQSAQQRWMHQRLSNWNGIDRHLVLAPITWFREQLELYGKYPPRSAVVEAQGKPWTTDLLQERIILGRARKVFAS